MLCIWNMRTQPAQLQEMAKTASQTRRVGGFLLSILLKEVSLHLWSSGLHIPYRDFADGETNGEPA